MDKIIGKQLPKKDQDNEHWVSGDAANLLI